MKNSMRFFIVISLLISSLNTVAQTFPPCQGTDNSAWSRCTAPTLVFDNGNSYAGEWLNGKPNGQGTYTFKNTGDTYKGQFADSKFNGTGVFTWANGTQYVGQFSNSYITGQGTKTWNTKQKYVGHFVNGYMEGTGTFTWPNGAKYVGQWQKSLGVNGTYTYPNGATAVGTVDKNGAFAATVQQAQAPQQRQQPAPQQQAPQQNPNSLITRNGYGAALCASNTYHASAFFTKAGVSDNAEAFLKMFHAFKDMSEKEIGPAQTKSLLQKYSAINMNLLLADTFMDVKKPELDECINWYLGKNVNGK